MRQLGRQAGSALTQTRTVPAPDDLRLELIEVPAGADVALEVRFEAVSEGVLATGTATAPLAGECARCLTSLDSTVTASFTELYLYQEKHDRHDKHDDEEQRDDQAANVNSGPVVEGRYWSGIIARNASAMFGPLQWSGMIASGWNFFSSLTTWRT